MMINTFSTSYAGNVNRSRSWFLKVSPSRYAGASDVKAAAIALPRTRAGAINAGITASYFSRSISRHSNESMELRESRTFAKVQMKTNMRA